MADTANDPLGLFQDNNDPLGILPKQDNDPLGLFPQKTEPVKPEIKDISQSPNITALKQTGQSFLQPFKDVGNVAARGFTGGTAAFMGALDDMATYVSEKTGFPKGGLFEASKKLYADKAQEYAEKTKNTGITNEILGEFLGGAIPGMAQFILGTPFAAIHGYTKDGVEGALKEGAHRFMMGKVLHSSNPLKRPERVVTMGTIGGVDAYMQGGDIKDIAKGAGVMSMFGMMGGPGKVGLKEATKKWDSVAKEKIIEPLKEIANSKITNETVRHQLGLNRSKEAANLIREFQRDAEIISEKALEVGKELQEIAPEPAQQRRLMQVMKGSITSNPAMQAKAEHIRGKFNELRELQKEYKLREYSRFENVTRQERADLRNQIKTMEKELQTTPEGNKADTILENIEIARNKLNNYYHFGSAKEYAPTMYDTFEGFSPKQRKSIKSEIKRLKKLSRKSSPEGKQEYEDLIASMEGLFKKETLTETKTKMDLGYTHMRQDIPLATQKLLGKIDEAPYPIAKGLERQTTDIRTAELFKEIAENPEWVVKPVKGSTPPANFKQVEGKQFGELDGKYVRKDVYSDLTEIIDVRNSFIKNWDTALGWWKFGKVVLNPAAHSRNIMSNTILAYMGDAGPADIARGADIVLRQKENNVYYRDAKEWGLFNNTFARAEINKLRDGLQNLRDNKGMRNWIRKSLSLTESAYQKNEEVFKMAVYTKARLDGLNKDAAARKAEEFLFNYGDIPPWVKHTKRWVSPFFTFTYKAIPKTAETMIRKPWKIGAIAATMMAIEEYSKAKMGLSDKEAEKQRKMLPEWQQGKVFGAYAHLRTPWTDDYGNNELLDLSYILPYGTMGERWGQSKIPLADIMPNNPLLEIAYTTKFNKDSFTGREIYNEILDGNKEILEKYLAFSWRQLAPSLAPGGHSFDKLKTGFQNTIMGKDVRDWADRPLDLQTAILSTFLGIKLSPINEKKMKEFQAYQVNKIESSVNKQIQKLKTKKMRNKITEEEFRSEIQQLMEIRNKLIKAKLNK